MAKLELMLESDQLIFLSLTINVVYSVIIFYIAIVKTKRELTALIQRLPFPVRKPQAPSTCSYYLGYLQSYPRKKGIPETCWGCTELLECVEHKPARTEKTPKIDQNNEKSKGHRRELKAVAHVSE